MLDEEVEENIEVHHQMLTMAPEWQEIEEDKEKEEDKEDTEAEPATWTLP